MTWRAYVYREHLPRYGWVWTYAHPTAPDETRGSGWSTGRRKTWRDAMNGLQKSIALRDSGWRP